MRPSRSPLPCLFMSSLLLPWATLQRAAALLRKPSSRASSMPTTRATWTPYSPPTMTRPSSMASPPSSSPVGRRRCANAMLTLFLREPGAPLDNNIAYAARSRQVEHRGSGGAHRSAGETRGRPGRIHRTRKHITPSARRGESDPGAQSLNRSTKV